MKLKLHVMLAKTEQASGPYKKSLEEYVKFFKDNQGAFKGIRKTYEPRPGTADDSGMRENRQVVTTVKEKLDWFTEFNAPYLNDLFTVDATNAGSGILVPLVVDGKTLATVSSLELMRLKGLIESGILENMYQNIPVRSDAEIWNPTTQEMYKDREIFESERREGTKTTIDKETYILDDPNIGRVQGAQYQPKTAERSTVREIGDYTLQSFTGEYSTRQKADILTRRTKLLVAITEALKIANEAEIIESSLKAENIFAYLHYNQG